MPVMFHDVRLPEEVEQGAIGGPSFYTNVVTQSSGAEQRTSLWDRQRLMWQLGYGISTKQDYEGLLAFFYARRGKAFGFRFRDFSDYTTEDAQFGIGNGSNRVFRLVKPYASGSTTFNRIITHPQADSVVLKIDGVVIDSATYDLEDFGIIRFHSGHAPANTAVLTWTGYFDVPVRFDVDQFNLTLYALATGDIENNALPIIELREQINSPPTAVNITNTITSVNADASTASRIQVATFEIVDDDLGTNVVGLTGTDPSVFEVVLDAGTRTGTLYLRASTVLDHAAHPSYQVTVGVWDSVVGTRPSATASYTLTVNEVALPPVVTLTNTTQSLALATDTTSRILLADIGITANLGQSTATTLTGADASHFELFGGNLYLLAGEDTSTIHHYTDLQIVVTPSVAAATVVPFELTIGVVAGSMTYSTPGSFSFTVPEYGTLSIEVQEPGNASWGYTPGASTPPTAPERTYVQNDQTVTLFHRWRVEGFRMADNPDAYTPGYTIATAVQASLGIGASLEDANPGVVGGLGVAPVIKATDFDLPSGAGGYATWLGAVVLGGAPVRAAAPAPTLVTTANGVSGSSPGAGASGGVYKKNNLALDTVSLGTTPPNQLVFASTAGGASGMFAKYTWTFGSVQVGSGAGYTAPAPAVGDILTIVIGHGGVKGGGTVTGGDGSPGRVKLSWS